MTASREVEQPVAGVSDPGAVAGARGSSLASLPKAGRSAPAEPLSTRRQLELMRDLQRLANERHAEEERVRDTLADGLRSAADARDKAAAESKQQFTDLRAQASARFEHVTGEARRLYEERRNAAQQEYKGLRQGVESEVSRITQAARSEQQQQSWEALTLFDALKGRPRERFQATVQQLNRMNQELAVLEQDAVEIMKMRRQWREFPPVEPSAAVPQGVANHKAQRVAFARGPGSGEATTGDDAPDPVDQAIQCAGDVTTAVRNAAIALQRQKLPRLFEGGWPFGLFVLAWIASAVPAGMAFGWNGWQWLAASGGGALVVTAALMGWLWPLARRLSARQYRAVQQSLADARQALTVALEQARERARRETEVLVADRDQQLIAGEEQLHAVVGERERWKESEIGRAGQTFPQRLAELRTELEATLRAAKEEHSEALMTITQQRDERDAEIREQYVHRCRELRAEHDRDWQALAQRWHDGLAELRRAWDRMDAACERFFPNWESTDYSAWPKPEEAAPAIQLGDVSLDLAQVKHGIPRDERLRPAETLLRLPALMTLDEHPVLLITAEEEGRPAGVEVLQLAMLRMLTAMPPGKVRFTILDPVGLGENFASFMHLADFDEQLIASRIWTDSRQIDEQLTRLTAHMETVLQKYLRNEFATIHEYNAQAGEVAEPFQVLVVANFPTNFGESAARKLVSIATSGPRCGVYTLIMVDRKQKMPANFDLSDLKAAAVHLDWVPGNGVAGAAAWPRLSGVRSGESPSAPQSQPPDGESGRFRWRYPAFERLPLALHRPPSPERFNDVVRAAGRAAKESMKVEVPFEQVAPPEDEYWSGSSAKELVVPIGRAGARRLQPVRLGKGTSQHLLVCGKTGSGKSTFLHALITNTALHYSPDEVEFYLIDFKKGVEFKTYATHRLPHARVIAIESEREFGLSVLERLDAELRRRGDLFRAAGVQDLADYRAHVAEFLRNSNSAVSEKLPHVMPRVLLVIDEFQELFVEDDKLAQEAALLLDRLVRQGRAFGIHVLLGSQTLSGAYSLARSTMGQMAVRVALQCSEADANLILSDERNNAARFLSRPGEAIYNDQNGIVAGNHPFQVVWLPEAKRIEYLKQIERQMAEDEQQQVAAGGPPAETTGEPPVPRETIVFEGDQPADPANNSQLRAVLQQSRSSLLAARSSPQKAWLGAAVAITEPTAATFGRHAGSNLLVVGAWEESALGVLTNALIALAAQNGDCPLFLPEGATSPNDLKQEKGTVPLGAPTEPNKGDSPLFASEASRQDNTEERKKGTVPAAPRFYILDGTRPESPEAGTWQRIASALPEGKNQLAGPRDTARVIGEVAAELARRESAGEEDAPPVYLVIFNGGRFRDLRRNEDDFSFSTDRDKPPAPDKQWAEILRNGPAWGIHTLLWCDSYNNVNRLLDRMMLREFEMRVAFQMSAADSSSLLDTPAATKLRQHRGLFASEDLGTLEKFRPYGVPTAAWLDEIKRTLSERQ